MNRTQFDAVVVGSGPNGLAAAITLQEAGLAVLLLEAKATIGGGHRTEALTLPGYLHDVCSAIHPMAAASPFLRRLPLEKYGLEYIEPPICMAHPVDGGGAAVLHRSMDRTAAGLGLDATGRGKDAVDRGKDAAAYRGLYGPLISRWPGIVKDVLGAPGMPRRPLAMAQFGLHALAPALTLARRFRTTEARALWGGLAAHSIVPLSYTASSAIGLVLSIAAHTTGWPLPKGGSVMIARAMAAYFESIGGRIETGMPVESLAQLPGAKAVLFDVGPRQLLRIAGHKLTGLYRQQLSRFRYGPGVFKIDWALDAPIPFVNEHCRQAGTVHIGGTLEEIAFSEHEAWNGRQAERPFILLAQQSLFDPTRAPQGKHTAYAYCHVPNGSTVDRTAVIEAQIERYAPGFRERVLARHTMNTAEMEAYNANYIGGDINGGAIDIRQLFTRPALRSSPYRTSAKGIYICSASTPPGGGVHGLCGYHAARRAIRDLFKERARKD